MLGFSFNGIHSSEFGICMKSKNRSVLPSPKTVYEDIASRDGIFDFSYANPLCRCLYKEREISVECNFISDSHHAFRKDVRKIASWLAFTEGKLIFDDEPDVYYLARVTNKLDLTQQLKRGFFTIVFTCRPFAVSFLKSGTDNIYGGNICYDEDMEYGPVNIFPVTASNLSINVKNRGIYVAPKIIVDGVFDNIRFEYKNSSINFNSSGSGRLAIDCSNMTVVLNGNNALPLISGSFFELENGNNDVKIAGSNLNCTVCFDFNYLYL